MSFIYLHGFASGPASKKASFFKERFSERGVELNVPDLNVPTFRKMTLTSQLDHVDRILTSNQTNQSVLIGSSMGGLVAALSACRSNSVRLLVLLAPGFGIEQRWCDLVDDHRRKQWRETGTIEVFHFASKQNELLDYDFVDDLKNYSSRNMRVSIPTLILHGKHDAVVPIEESVAFKESNPHAELIALEDDHELVNSLDEIWRHVDRFLL